MKSIVVFIFVITLASCNQKPAPSLSFDTISKQDSIPSKVMLDQKVWMTKNLNLIVENSFCPADSLNCQLYGRLYTWKAAIEGCRALAEGWRLPTNEEWQNMAKLYGGIVDDSNDQGKAAYINLSEDGIGGFNALLAGNRQPDGDYQRLGAHGFYWTATESDSTEAWFYNFAKNATLLNHHTGSKLRAISVRCVKKLANSGNDNDGDEHFTSVYDTLRKIDLPLTWTPVEWSDLYMKHIEKYGIRHGDLTTDRPYGMLVDEENYKGIIFVSPDATGSPVLLTFDRNGKQVDGMMLMGDWGNNDPSFGTSEIVTIDENRVIHMIDSISTWDLDETGDRIESTKKTTVKNEWYQILTTGVIKKIKSNDPQ